MEVEYVALSTSCHDLFPLIHVTNEICSIFHVGLMVYERADLNIKIYEDNISALTLGKLDPQQMTPRLKHYAIKYHWFQEHLGPRRIQLVRTASSEEQLGNRFTKGLSGTFFFQIAKEAHGLVNHYFFF
jgi:hypothetical protein